MKTKLKSYAGWGWNNITGAEEGTCLIFAKNSAQARELVYNTLQEWYNNAEWIGMRVWLITGADHLFQEADKEKLEKNIPHVIESPRTCKRCGLWGRKIEDDGVCVKCHTYVL